VASFFLDFCEKYNHPQDNPDSLKAFMLKLAQKNQTPEKQRQAARSVKVYFDIVGKNK
jgi:hypothetical protein